MADANLGRALEDAVATIERCILKSFPEYTENSFRIQTRKRFRVHGVTHEIDVYVEVDLGRGYSSIFLFECKNWTTESVSKNDIIVFSEKIKALSAQRGYVIAPRFTADAVAQAKQDPRLELLSTQDMTAPDIDQVLGGFRPVGIERVSTTILFSTPLEVSQGALRKSLNEGATIPNANSWQWDIHRQHPVCQLFPGKVTKFQRRLLDCAVQIQEAACATSYATQLQMAVAAMEVLLKPKSFSDLERILKAFFQGSDEKIESILRTRHSITHEGAGRGDDDGHIKDSARHALNFSWLMLDIVTAFDRGVTTVTFDEYIAMLTSAVELDAKSLRLESSKPGAHQQLLHKATAAFRNCMTAKVKFEGAA